MNFASKKAIYFITDLNLPNEAIVDKSGKSYYLLTDLLDKFSNQKAKIDSVKEIEFRINKVKEIIAKLNSNTYTKLKVDDDINLVDTLLFDINDFINDLKE